MPRLNESVVVTAARNRPLLVSFITVGDSLARNSIILANLCRRGDKDIFTVAGALGVAI